MNDIRPPSPRLPRPLPPPGRQLRPVAPRSAPPLEAQRSIGLQSLPPPAPSLQMKRPQETKKSWKKWLLVIFAALVLCAGFAVFFAYTWYVDALKPLSSSQERVIVLIPEGSTVSAAMAKLEDQKVIKSGFALEIYVKLHNLSDIKAGKYMFTPNQDPIEILKWLNEGKTDTSKITILPGKTVAELKETFKKFGYTPQAIETAFTRHYDHPLLADKPDGMGLEGYIYPETYIITPDTLLETIFTQGFDLFYKRLQQEQIPQKVSAKGLTLYGAITLASIVEKEVHGKDQYQVAQVFLTRLARPMPLGSDATYVYGASLLGVEPSPLLDSPYNTRIHEGLPPGPVANFNFAAIEAVANPAAGDFIYFVTGDDGITYFSHTFEEHQANIDNHCLKLCSQN